MNPTVDELMEQAEKLSADDLEILLGRLRQKYAPAMDPEIEAAWTVEVERRADGMDDGTRPAVPWGEARKLLGLV